MILHENTTVQLGDTVAIDSAGAQSPILSIGMNTQALDECASNQQPGDQMEDSLEKVIALDSEDEGENQNEGVNSVSSSGVVGRFSGRHSVGFLRRQQAPAGYFRRLNEVSENVLRGYGSATCGRSAEESTAGRTGLYNDDKFQERVVVNNVASSPSEQEPVLMNIVNTEEFLDMGRDGSTEDLLERKLPSDESKYMTTVKDTNYDYKRADYSESQQVAESQDKAMQFVDDYLSVCDFGSYKDIPATTTHVMKSPPSLRSMGAQSLARRLTLGSTASKLTAFEWAENHVEKTEGASLRLHKDSVLGFRGDTCGSVSVNQERPYVNLHNEISIDLQSEEMLLGNRSSINNEDTVWLSSNDTENICIIPDSLELDVEHDTEILSHTVDNVEHDRLTQELSYVGLDTQIAAEAMQELVHADHPRADAFFTHQGSDNTLLESCNAVNNMEESNFASNEVAIVDWRFKGKRSKSMKISTVQNKRLSRLAAKRLKNQRGTVSQPVVGKKMTKKRMADDESCNERMPEITSNKRFAAPSRITMQQVEYETIKRYSSKQFQKLDRLCSRLSSDTADGVKYETPQNGRKISSSFHDGAHRKGSKDNCLRSNSGHSFGANTDSAEGKENCCLNQADMTLPELNPWVYPKGKRSRQCTSAVKPSNRCSPFATVDSNPGKYPREKLNENAVDGVAKLLVYSRRRKVSLERDHTGSSLQQVVDSSSSRQCTPAVKPSKRNFPFATADNNQEKYPRVKLNEDAVDGVAKLIVYNRRRKVSIGRQQAGSSLQQVVDLSSSVNNIETTFDSYTSKPLKQCCTLDEASFNIKSEGSGKRKRSLSSYSRSPLIKELVRLGYADSPPDFLPKNSRRKRATDKVCILFSQNLDTSTLKQQKKIVARLGFSIASCSSDATHFVADRFIRTRNMLEAIGLGKPVVTHLWLESCDQAGYVIDESSYILRDEKKEKEYGFNMHVTLTRASQLPLLKGRRVLITRNVKPGIDVINSLVKAVQGQVVQNIVHAKKDELIHKDILILSSEEDYTICLQFLQKGASIYDSELLLNGILTQKLEYERYRLFKDHKEDGDCFIMA